MFKKYISSKKLTSEFKISTSLLDSLFYENSVEKVSTNNIFEDIKRALISRFSLSIKASREGGLETRSISLYVFSESELKELLTLHNDKIESMWRSRIFSDNTEVNND